MKLVCHSCQDENNSPIFINNNKTWCHKCYKHTQLMNYLLKDIHKLSDFSYYCTNLQEFATKCYYCPNDMEHKRGFLTIVFRGSADMATYLDSNWKATCSLHLKGPPQTMEALETEYLKLSNSAPWNKKS